MGALTAGRRATEGPESLALRWADGAVILLTILAVRVMVRGIPFVP
jgi:hypothetical protein